MELEAGKTAVVTGAASGIGAALATRFATAGMNVVIADVDETGMAATASAVEAAGGTPLTVPTDVSSAEAVNALADATLERFGGVQVVCNNAGVVSNADAWLGPLSAWEWVLGVNLMGVVHGVRTFLPHLVMGGGGHIVNTASIAGLYPGLDPIYDASKHAVVALTENLYHTMQMADMPVGISVLCPGWVNTGILEADRNWPTHLGERPDDAPGSEVGRRHVSKAIAEGLTPAAVADVVADAVQTGRYWVFPHPDWLGFIGTRWDQIREQLDPELQEVPGMPTPEELRNELRSALGLE